MLAARTARMFGGAIGILQSCGWDTFWSLCGFTPEQHEPQRMCTRHACLPFSRDAEIRSEVLSPNLKFVGPCVVSSFVYVNGRGTLESKIFVHGRFMFILLPKCDCVHSQSGKRRQGSSSPDFGGSAEDVFEQICRSS